MRNGLSPMKNHISDFFYFSVIGEWSSKDMQKKNILNKWLNLQERSGLISQKFSF